MKKERFAELLESVREGGRILRGEATASRRFSVPEPDVRKIRATLGKTQPAFAAMLGVDVGTLRGWEQKRRRPTGAARVLLRVADKHPEAIVDSLNA